MVGPSLTGHLIVANPALDDPNFTHTVVLICAHTTEAGAFGLVLNRALAAPVADAIPKWNEHVASPAVLFSGGPVETTRAAALGLRRDGAIATHWNAVSEFVGLVDLEPGPDASIAALEAVRIFAGYAGWGPGQLENEVRGEAWYVVPARPEDAFTQDPDGLWERVLRRQPGGMAMFAFFPHSPSLN